MAEQSLDIDADLLGTEMATVHALVQRFGRSAREYPLPSGRVGRILVSDPYDINPYSSSDMAAAQKFLAYLDGRTVFQAGLEEAMLRFAPEAEEVEQDAGVLRLRAMGEREGRDVQGHRVLHRYLRPRPGRGHGCVPAPIRPALGRLQPAGSQVGR